MIVGSIGWQRKSRASDSASLLENRMRLLLRLSPQPWTYWVKYYRTGKAYRESAKSTKEGAAKRLLKKREGEVAEGKILGIYFDRVRFEELAEDYLTDYRVNGKKTLKWTERRIKLHLSPFFGGMRVTDITAPRIKAYVAGGWSTRVRSARRGSLHRIPARSAGAVT